MRKELVLGTAMWGWSVKKSTAFQLLNDFYQAGFRRIDTATNYPLNSYPWDFLKAENYLAEWIAANCIQDLKVLYKFGSLSNQRSPDNNLSPAFVEKCYATLLEKFGNNLSCLMVHWDNRAEHSHILETLKSLQALKSVEIGLSGIKATEAYSQCLKEARLKGFLMQTKENPFHSDIERYSPFFDGLEPKYLAYGISGGGLKLHREEYSGNSSVRLARPSDYHDNFLPRERVHVIETEIASNKEINSFYDYCLMKCLENKKLWGVILGPSKPSHLKSTLSFYNDYHSALTG